MSNPFDYAIMIMATTGGWFGGLSDKQKGFSALIAMLVLGFTIGTVTVSQVGLPARVEAVERRVENLEAYVSTSRSERQLIGRILNWHTCAIEANNDGIDIQDVCGRAPQYTFGN